MKSVLCVPRTQLFASHAFEGFCSQKTHDFLPLILRENRPLARTEELENNPQEKQMITYLWILNPETKKVLIYQRAHSTQHYEEKRLLSKWSAGIGGHVEPSENADPIMAACKRELREELTMNIYPKPHIIGFVNQEKNVEAMHFGIVGIVHTTEDVKKGDNEMSRCQFVSVEELDALMSSQTHQFEVWTQLTWPVIKEHYLTK